MVIEVGPSTGTAAAASMAIGAGASTATAGGGSTVGAPLTAVESAVSTAAVPFMEAVGFADSAPSEQKETDSGLTA
jgi:hypothetical protein